MRTEEIAAKHSPKGYALWATYPSKVNAEAVKEHYGSPSDIIAKVPGRNRWALYGLAE